MRFLNFLLYFVLIMTLVACGSDAIEHNNQSKEYRKFAGRSYRSAFNDLQALHIEAAIAKGVGPLKTRDDTITYAKSLVKIPAELEIYKLDNLKHSIPFLVKDASDLLLDIALDFRDSLISRDMPLYKLKITSVTRTDVGVQKLAKRNANASEDSSHRYATTFDISWTRYDKVDMLDERVMNDGQLKAILGHVLFNLRERDRCYIKHEVRQSCFHITVR